MQNHIDKELFFAKKQETGIFRCAAPLRGLALFYFAKKEGKIMSDKAYIEAVRFSAEISERLTVLMSEEAQELFEKYCELYERILKAEIIG